MRTTLKRHLIPLLLVITSAYAEPYGPASACGPINGDTYISCGVYPISMVGPDDEFYNISLISDFSITQTYEGFYEPSVCNIDNRTVITCGIRLMNNKDHLQALFAHGFRYRLNNLNLPPGGEIYFYDPLDPSVYIGPYTDAHNGVNILSDYIQAGWLAMEYSVPAHTPPGNLFLDEIFIYYPVRENPDDQSQPYTPDQTPFVLDEGGAGESSPLNYNVTCDEVKSWSNEKDAVVIIAHEGSPFGTGALINNPGEDGTPYIVTAKHVAETYDPGELEFIFNYQSQTCSGPSGTGYHYMRGAYSTSFNDFGYAEGDYAILRLFEPIPDNIPVSYLGWDAAWNAQVRNPVVIHHPGGDFKKIAFSNTADNIFRNVSYDDPGLPAVIAINNGWIQPGSSGSPLLNHDHSFIGNLSFVYEDTPQSYPQYIGCVMMHNYLYTEMTSDPRYLSFPQGGKGPYIANHDYTITDEIFDATTYDNLGAGFFRTMKSISAGGNVKVRNTEVKFCAAQRVILSPGFHAEAGCTFTAKTFVPGQNYDYPPAAKSHPEIPERTTEGDMPAPGILSASPNPFTDRVDMALRMPSAGKTPSFSIMDSRGGLIAAVPVRTGGGMISATWDGKDRSGKAAPQGVYIGICKIGDKTEQIRILKSN